eukprot:365441-Chlamydomonas_euryale.AAC.21
MEFAGLGSTLCHHSDNTSLTLSLALALAPRRERRPHAGDPWLNLLLAVPITLTSPPPPSSSTLP